MTNLAEPITIEQTKKMNVILDASQYDLFLLCHQRYNYRYNLNRILPIKAKPLDKGLLVHIACETYYGSLQSGAKYDFAVDSALMKCKAAGAKSDLNNDELNIVYTTMEQYFDHWRVVDQSFEIVAVENPFLYLLHEDDQIRIYMAGKIDLIVSDNRYTNLPYDHKSFERTSPINEMSNQFKNYCNALQSNTLVVNRIGFQKTLPAEQKFLRVPVQYDPLKIADWKENVILNVMEYVECRLTNRWPMNETSCDKYHRQCEYYEICNSSGIAAKNHKLLNNYIDTEPWDVSSALKKSSEMADSVKVKVENEIQN